MLNQKQVKNFRFNNLTELTASSLNTPDVAYVADQNFFYTKISGVNTRIGTAIDWATIINKPSAANQVWYGAGLQSSNLTFDGTSALSIGSSSSTTAKLILDRTNASVNSSYSVFLSSANSPTIQVGYGLDFTGERSGTADLANGMYQWFVPSANQMQFGRINKSAGTTFTSADEIPYLTLGNSSHTLHQATYISQSAIDGGFTLNKTSGTTWNYIQFQQAGTRQAYTGINNNSEYLIGVDGTNKGIILQPNGTGQLMFRQRELLMLLLEL